MTKTETKPRGTTRERILDVALDMFVAEGFGGTAIIEVERRVGLKPGTGSFYRHFGSKEELLRAAVAREVSRCEAVIASSHSLPPLFEDPREARAHELRVWLQDIQHFHRLFRLLLSDGDRFPEVRAAIAAARPPVFQKPGADLDAVDVVATTALLGYQLLCFAWGQPYLNLTEDEFIAALVRSLEQPAPDEPSTVGLHAS